LKASVRGEEEMMAWLAIVVIFTLRQDIGNECSFSEMNALEALEALIFRV